MRGTSGSEKKVMKKVFVFDGQYAEYRKKSYGNSTENNPGDQFVIFSQNHDQVGNRLWRCSPLRRLNSAKTAMIMQAIE